MISSGIGGLRRTLLAGVPAWAAFISGAHAACAPATPATGQTVTCSGGSAAFIAPAGVTGLTVAITPGATIAAAQTSAGNNPSFTNVRVNGSSTVNNAGTIANTTPLNRDNFGVNLAGDLSTLNNSGTITLTAPAGNATTRVYGAYSSAPNGSQYTSTTVTNSGTIAVTQNGNGIARGIYSGENTSLFTVTNTGLISAARGTTATASTSAVAAVDSDDDTDRLVVNNGTTGRITASGTNSRALSGRAAQYEITNSGTISNTTAGEAAIATFALNAGNAGDATTPGTYNTVIVNTATGVINGDVRNTDQDLQTATTVVNLRRTGTLTNAGTINGNVAFGGGSQIVNNTGIITGGISFLDVATTVNSVTLGTGSVIGGAITATGRGRNALTLTGTGTLASNVAGFTTLRQTDGAWTLAAGATQSFSGGATVAGGTLTVNATLNAATQVASGATLAGTGTLVGAVTNAGTVAPGSAASPYGTLTVSGAYTQGPGGALLVALAPNANARLAVTGAAQLNGALVLNAAAGTYVPGTTYRLVTAGSTTGAFTSVSTSGLPTLLGAAVTQNGGATTLTLVQQSFGLVARTGNQASAARGVDAVLAGNSAALTVLDNRSDAQNAAFLDRVAGQGYAAVADPELRSGRAFGTQMMARAYAAGSEAGATGFVLPPAVYAADLPGRGPVPAPRFVEVNRGYGVWATGYGQFGHVDSTANAAGRSETVAGMAAGIDMHPSVNSIVGVAVGYGSVDVSLGRTGERAHLDNAQVGVYGGYTDGAFYANGALGYARAEGRVNRAIGLPQIQPGGAQGDIGGDQFIAAGELGYRVPVATATQIVPLVGYQVNTFSQDRVRETGGGSFDLTVAGKDFLSARTLVGGRLETATAVAGKPVTLFVKAAYVHDFADVNRTISASFTLAPTVPFLVAGRRLDRDRALVTAGIGIDLAPRLQGFVAYDAELASSDTIQAVRGGVRYAF